MRHHDDEDDFYDDQYEHMKDVLGMEEREDLGGGEEEEIDKNKEDEDLVATEYEYEQEVKVKLIPVSQWSWEMNTEDRLAQASLLEKKYKELLAILNVKRNYEIEVAREEYHKSKVRAKSRVYESKTVIGGTMVGCIGRF
uniref:Uncharacterized protein n=1 Tax=Clytia hemisphaerica TaxID=252671 RepID=A0A7M5WTE8_9CNID